LVETTAVSHEKSSSEVASPVMSEQRLYIRVRGRVSGPFSLQQLKTLRDRGQFRRFHEISPDRQQWSPAAGLADLFAPEAAGASAPLTFPELEEPAVSHSNERGKPRSAPVQWHYVDASGNPQGPVPQDQLLTLWQQRLLSADTLVWHDGMSDWVEITAPETGLSLGPARSRLVMPAAVWIGALAALGGVILAILAYLVYKWGEHQAENVGVGPENYHVRRPIHVAAHDGSVPILDGGGRARPVRAGLDGEAHRHGRCSDSPGKPGSYRALDPA
jgi:hypothetical protein